MGQKQLVHALPLMTVVLFSRNVSGNVDEMQQNHQDAFQKGVIMCVAGMKKFAIVVVLLPLLSIVSSATTLNVTIEEVNYLPRITGSHGLAESIDGVLYLSDSYAGSDQVYRIHDGGREPVATGFSIPAGLWQDDSGRFYVCDVGGNRIYRYQADWTMDTSWIVPNPWNMVLDGTDIICTSYNGSVYRIDGSGTHPLWTGLQDPFGIAQDEAGNLYVSEHTAGRISKRKPDGSVSVLTDSLTQPEGIRIGPEGRLWVADTVEGKIYIVEMDGTTKLLDSAGFNFDVAVNLSQSRDNHLYLGCAGGNGRIYKLTLIPDPTPTAPTPTPTSIPTASVTPTPTVTPACMALGTALQMPLHYYIPGETCNLHAEICNPDGSAILDIPFFIILEVMGEFVIGPDFATQQPWILTISTGLTDLEIIPDFIWPSSTGSLENCMFYGAMTDPDITHLLGEMGMWQFGFGEP